MDEGRLPPQDIEAEEACLGSILIEPSLIHELATFLNAEDFYRETNRRLFEVLLELSTDGQPIDLVSVGAAMRQRDYLDEAGGEAYLLRLIQVPPTHLHAENYAKIVHKLAINRKVILAAGAMAGLAYETSDSEDVLEKSEQLLYDIRRSNGLNQDSGPIRNYASDYLEEIEELAETEGEMTGLPSGFLDLDRLLGGFQKKQLTIVGARPSMGKTAFVLQVAMKNAMEDKNVGIFSLEMSAREIMQRLTSTMARINSQDLRHGKLAEKDWPVFYQTVGAISESGLYICDTAGLTISKLRSKAMEWATRYGLDMIVTDYLQLLRAEGFKNNRVQEMSYIGKALKQLARELDIPVIAVSQLNRSVEQRGNKRPNLSDLRDSGTIEEDGDVIIFIYRDEYYNPETSERPNIGEFNVAKNRNGPQAIIDLFWQGQFATFRNLQRQEIRF